MVDGGGPGVTRNERLHRLAVAAITGHGLSRTDAFHQVAADQRVRPGVVAAAYYRVERAKAEAARPDRPCVGCDRIITGPYPCPHCGFHHGNVS